MSLQNFGEPPSRPNDYVDLQYLQTNYPSTSARVTTYGPYTVALPSGPADQAMFLVEVVAPTVAVSVTFPAGVLLTAGMVSFYTVGPGKTGFFGFRYSSSAQAWFALSAAIQS